MNTINHKKTRNAKSPLRGDLEGCQSFYYYLKDNKLAERTIRENVKDIKRFYEWARVVFSLSPSDKRAFGEGWERSSEGEGSGIERINYNELLQYVHYLKRKSLSIHTINARIGSIRKYYEHLKEEGIAEINPARRLFIKGGIRKIVKDILSYNELENLYQQYTHYLDQKPMREKKQQQTKLRSKVITGLMIWQAVHSGELKKMCIEHINLQKGTVYIPSTSRKNSRELKLDSRQIIVLHKFLEERSTSAQVPLPNGGAEGRLLIPYRAYDQVARIISELKGINQTIRNAQHIRASVIFHWLKMYDKRQVQYMIGHKWISSTEHYEMQQLDGLTDLLAKHHPFS